MPAVEYNLNADADDLIKGFEAAARVMAEANREAAALERQEKKLEKATRDAAKAAKDGEVNLGKLAQSAGVLSPSLGNAVRGLDDLAAGVGELGGVLGPVTLGVGALVVGCVGLLAAEVALVAGMISLGGAAGEAGARIEHMGLLTADQIKLAKDFRTNTDASANATDALTVKVAAAVPLLDDLVAATTGAKVIMGLLFDELDDVGIALKVIETVNPGTVLLIEHLAEAGRAAAASQSALGKASEAAAESTKAAAKNNAKVEKEYADLVDSILGQIYQAEEDSQKARTAAHAKGVADRAAAERDAARDAIALNASMNTFYEKAIDAKAARDAQILAKGEADRLDRKAQAAKDAADADALAAKAQAEADKRQKQIEAGIRQGVEGTVQAIADIAQAQADARLAETDANLDASRSREADLREQLLHNKTLTQDQRDQISRRIAMEDQSQKALQAIRKRQAEAAKRTAIAQALIGAALAIVQCFAQLGPIGGAVAAIPVGITTGAEVAAISRQQFHDGGSLGHGPDEFGFGGGQVGRAGEQAKVFNQRAAEQGAGEVADEMNRRGLDSAGSGKLELHIDGRSIGEATVREQRKPGSPLAPARGDGFTNPFKGGR